MLVATPDKEEAREPHVRISCIYRIRDKRRNFNREKLEPCLDHTTVELDALPAFSLT